MGFSPSGTCFSVSPFVFSQLPFFERSHEINEINRDKSNRLTVKSAV